MNLNKSAVETAKSIFDSHHAVCPACHQCPLDGEGGPMTSSLSILCHIGTCMFKQLMRARTEVDRVKDAQAKSGRTKKKNEEAKQYFHYVTK